MIAGIDAGDHADEGADPDAEDRIGRADREHRREAAADPELLAVGDEPGQPAPRCTPPTSEISRPSPAMKKKIACAGKPSVRITAISVVRSRTDIAIVFAATNSVVMTTASAMLPSSRFRLPNIEAKELWNCFSVSVLVS